MRDPLDMDLFDRFNVEPNTGGWFILRRDGNHEYTPQRPKDLKIIDREYVKNLLYRSGRQCIEFFSKTEYNRNVYAVSYYVELAYGNILMYINTEEGLAKTVQSRYSDWKEHKQKSLRYATGDFAFMFQFGDRNELRRLRHDFFMEFTLDLPDVPQFESAYYAVTTCPRWLELKEDLAMENDIFSDNLKDIALEVTRKLEELTGVLDKTEDFIMFYSDHEEDFFYNPEYERRYWEFTNLWFEA